MCPPTDRFHNVGGDKYSGHKLVAEAFSRYIILTPRLRCHPFRYSVPSVPPPVPLDIYIADSIHHCEIPEIVSYAACYLFISISQPCQCRIPHDDEHSDGPLSTPSRFSHILSRAVTRTPFYKHHWSDRHVFVGAFYLVLVIYREILSNEQGKELPCWGKLPIILGISEGEIITVAVAFKPYITPELRMAIESMIKDDCVRDIVEVDCPFVLARRKKLLKAELEELGLGVQEKSHKRKLSLKGPMELVGKLKRKPVRIL